MPNRKESEAEKKRKREKERAKRARKLLENIKFGKGAGEKMKKRRNLLDEL